MQSTQRKVVGAVALVAALVGGGAAARWVADDNGAVTVVSADEGARARAERDIHVPSAAGDATALEAERVAGVSTADALAIDCGTGAEPYVPTAEELASANADAEALASALERYGIAHTATTDEQGFVFVETDYADVVAQSVVDSFWSQRYPVEPPPPEELSAVTAQNDVIAAALDSAGVTYTRTTDAAGWESLEWDYEDPTAQAAVDAAYAELFPPQPPSTAELATMQADNDTLAAALDEAGIAHTRVSDELGWEWIEWDYDDQALNDRVNEVFSQLYPVGPLEGCAGVLIDPPTDGDLPLDVLPVPAPADDIVAVDAGEEFTPEQVAQRDGEAAAMTTGFDAAGVAYNTVGDSPWRTVVFDLDNAAAVPVITAVLDARS